MSKKINKISVAGEEYDIEDKLLRNVIETKQDQLISGENIKTINNESILGEGNISVAAGGYSLVRHGSNETTFELTPNVLHVWDKVDSLNLTLMGGTSNIANEYLFQFISGDNGTELELPSNISWNNLVKPVTINPNKVYQVRILMNCANLYEFDIVEEEPEIDYSREYFTIQSLEDNNEISFSNYLGGMKYLLSEGSGEWESCEEGKKIILNTNQKVKFKILDYVFVGGDSRFITTGKYIAFGNIMSLLYGDNFIGKESLVPPSFTSNGWEIDGLFRESKIVDASNLLLPATTLNTSCYSEMFKDCTLLITAPQLPATTLAPSCYKYMFYGCSSLTTAPKLPATTLADSCYEYMFTGCSSLTTAPELPATTLAPSCYSIMFHGCSSLTTAPELPATTLAKYCYEDMFHSCYGLTVAPELPATTLIEGCYQGMFWGCNSLTSAPELPAITLAYNCYQNMFCYCTGLAAAPKLQATILAGSCYDRMFYGCTKLTTAPELPATTLAEGCYLDMFNSCTSLTTAPELPATTLAKDCYWRLFENCTSLTTAPELPATTLAESCYHYMFSGCTGLAVAPELPAPTLANRCYIGMFTGCSNLSYIKMLATDISASDCLTSWVRGVSSTGTFVKNENATWDVIGANGIPSGWTVVNNEE